MLRGKALAKPDKGPGLKPNIIQQSTTQVCRCGGWALLESSAPAGLQWAIQLPSLPEALV